VWRTPEPQNNAAFSLNDTYSDGPLTPLWEDGERASQLFRHLERRCARPDSSLILETRRTCANNLAEHAGEMARILKTDSESHLQDVMLTIPEFLLGAFNSL
jgi:hypothetical protein